MSCVRASPNGEILYKNGEIRINRDRINEPLKYSEVCPTKALTVVGEIKSVYEIIGEIKKDSSFYNKSNGGVTLSGGESLAQKKFLFPLLKRLKEENIHVCIETSLHTNWTNIYDCVEYIDVFLADLKHTDEKKFKEFTDGDLQLVLENFKRLESMDAKVIVRVPVIPTFNNTKKEMKGIMRFAAVLHSVEEVHFIPFHTLGLNKYKLLSMKYNFIPTLKICDRELKEYVKLAKENGLRARIGG